MRRDVDLGDFGISQGRYRELLYFCRQYPEWKARLKARGVSAAKRAEASAKCGEVERAARIADPSLCGFIIKNVAEGIPYEILRARGMPSGRNAFLAARRRFFLELDKKK